MAENKPPLLEAAWRHSIKDLTAFVQQSKAAIAGTNRDLLSAASRVVGSTVDLINQKIPTEWLPDVKLHVAEVQWAVGEVREPLFAAIVEAQKSDNAELRAILSNLTNPILAPCDG